MKRILITGSRHWTDENLLALVLFIHGPGVIVHGGAPGADTLAAKFAAEAGWKVEEHRADWARFGAAAGPIRNQQMVDAGADICLAFPLPSSKGTLDCMKRAEKAGIPVEATGPDTSEEGIAS